MNDSIRPEGGGAGHEMPPDLLEEPVSSPRPADLTRAQWAVLNLIGLYVERNGYPPTMRELGRALGLRSSSTVYGHVVALRRKGYLTRPPEHAGARTTVPTDRGRAAIRPEGNA